MSGLKDRLRERKIQQVYYIDDENRPPTLDSVDQIAQAISKAPAPWVQDLSARDHRFDSISEARSAGENTDPEDLLAALRGAVNAQVEAATLDMKDFQTFAPWLHPDFKGPTAQKLTKPFTGKKFVPMSFKEWAAQSAEIIAKATAEQRLLLLVDEVNQDEGDVDLNGISLLARLWKLHADAIHFIDTIVITSNIDPKGEFGEALRLLQEVRTQAADPKVVAEIRRTFVISKQRLDANDLQHQFSVHLSRIAATDLRDQLAVKANAIFHQSVDEFMQWLERIPLSGFHGSLFASSQHEGTSEIDTLLRLINLRQRADLEERFRSDDEFQKKIAAMRRFSLNHLDAEYDAASQEELKALREQEFELAGVQVNKLMGSLACGDVFSVETGTGADKKAVEVMLLANPCDLVLRDNGKRKLQRGWIVVVRKVQRKDLAGLLRAGEVEAGGSLTYVLNTGVRDDDTAYIFENSGVDAIDLDLLDLCWTNSDGVARLDPAEAEKAMDFFLKPQRKRLKKLLLRASLLATSVDLFGTPVPCERTNGQPVKIETETFDTKFTAPIKRLWRLAPEFAAAALAALSQSISRPVFGHDFLRVK